jgi:hypothetical protein
MRHAAKKCIMYYRRCIMYYVVEVYGILDRKQQAMD